jgi:hypothetical protein
MSRNLSFHFYPIFLPVFSDCLTREGAPDSKMAVCGRHSGGEPASGRLLGGWSNHPERKESPLEAGLPARSRAPHGHAYLK